MEERREEEIKGGLERERERSSSSYRHIESELFA